MTTDDSVLARIAALKAMPAPELRRQWQQLFDTPPPRYNRRFLESRLAYRLQELAYGGLKPATVARLEALGEQLDGGDIAVRRRRADDRPIAGTKLVREYQGVLHHGDGAAGRLRVAGPAVQVAVGHRARDHRHALERPGVLRPQEPASRHMSKAADPKVALRHLHPQVERGRTGAGVQQPRRPARGLQRLHRQPAVGGLGRAGRPIRRRRRLRRHPRPPCPEAAAGRHRAAASSTWSSSTRSTG